MLLARINGIQKNLDSDPANQFLWDLDSTLREELNHILDQEEEYWKVRSREQWLTSGDRNTTFFHTSVLKRRKHNRITMLKDNVGNDLTTPLEIRQHIWNFYSNLFTIKKYQSHWPKNNPGTVNIAYLPSMREIRNAMFSSSPWKAPRKDGYHNYFF